jgi:phage portal protein BeeE
VSSFVSGGGLPSGIITHPDPLTAEQSAGLQEQWVTARMSSMGLPAVLSGGVEFTPTQQSPAEMGVVDLARMTESRLAILLGVPPFLVGLPSGGDSMTYSNVQQVTIHHWRAGLSTKASPVMAALSGWALPRRTTVEVNRDEYVKPDLLERAQAEQIYVGIGALSPEEVREMERFGIAAPSTTLTSGVMQ